MLGSRPRLRSRAQTLTLVIGVTIGMMGATLLLVLLVSDEFGAR